MKMKGNPSKKMKMKGNLKFLRLPTKQRPTLSFFFAVFRLFLKAISLTFKIQFLKRKSKNNKTKERKEEEEKRKKREKNIRFLKSPNWKESVL